MIDHNLPEPEPHLRSCYVCHRKSRLRGTLLHWPNETCKEEQVVLITGNTMAPFSLWYYTCQWCRAAETKRSKKYNAVGFSVGIQH